MTNAEAIKAIKAHCYFANLKDEAKEALDEAIKALSEPTIPLSAIEKIKAKIRHKQWYLGVDDANQLIGIIDDAVKEVNNNV